MTKRKNRRGFSLIEAAIVLGVVGLVIGGVWVSASTVRYNMKIREATNGILYTARNIQNKISTRESVEIGHNTFLNSFATGIGAYPKNWVSGSKASHPFSQKNSFQIVNKVYYPGPITFFEIWVYYLYPSECTDLVMRLSKTGNFEKDTSEDTIITTASQMSLWKKGLLAVIFYDAEYVIPPVSLNKAKAKCLIRGTGAMNTVGFAFAYTKTN